MFRFLIHPDFCDWHESQEVTSPPVDNQLSWEQPLSNRWTGPTKEAKYILRERRRREGGWREKEREKVSVPVYYIFFPNLRVYIPRGSGNYMMSPIQPRRTCCMLGQGSLFSRKDQASGVSPTCKEAATQSGAETPDLRVKIPQERRRPIERAHSDEHCRGDQFNTKPTPLFL